MKKNGFTLIELLAVIVILAIILAIAVPSITNMIESSRKSSFESDAKLLLQTIKYKNLEDETFDPLTITRDNMYSKIGIKNDKYQQISLEIIDNEIKVLLVGSDKWGGLTAYGTMKSMRVVNSEDYDTVAPVITLLGNSTVTIYQNTTYTDAGATALDNKDGDITSKIVITSTVNTSIVGSYTVTYNVTDNNGNSATAVSRTVNIQQDYAGPGYVTAKGVNGPVLTTGMTPIKWNGSSWVATTTNDVDWYNYTTTDKKWANARTADGSMWVWIPRYIYKISSGWHTATPGTIQVNFSKGIDDNWNSGVLGNIDTGTTANASNNKWTNHPGFTFGATELTGFWMAKFEPSGISSAINIKPGVASLVSTNVTDMFNSTRSMETNSRYGWGTSGNGIDTHISKNTEWGGALYLSKSSFGKTDEMVINSNSPSLTGYGNGYAYDTTQGSLASTTGNIYGIYDMNGASWEYTAAYINNASSSFTTYANSLYNADIKYKDVYPKGTTDVEANNYASTISLKGDAIYETSTTYTGTTAWYSDYSYMPRTDYPMFNRGGCYVNGGNSGAYSFYHSNGAGNSSYSFRPILLVQTGL